MADEEYLLFEYSQNFQKIRKLLHQRFTEGQLLDGTCDSNPFGTAEWSIAEK